MNVDELQRMASRGWPATETEPLGAWLLRAAHGFTRRANSALAFGDPGMPLDEALALIMRWYAARGLPAYLQLATGSPLDAELAARGWAPEAPVHVQIAPIASVLNTLPDDATSVTLTATPDGTWLARYHKTKNLSEPAAAVLRGGPAVCFAAIDTRAIGRCVLVDGWAGFSAIEVDPSHRRHGLARRVMRALLQWSIEQGATNAYLQVETDNTAALALYAAMGFTTHHTYHYRTLR